MLELFTAHPWLIVCALAVLVIVACVAIVFVTDYLRKTHQSEIDATLKHEMLVRGMSAADIKTVLEASADGEAARSSPAGDQSVRVGLGSFQVEVVPARKSHPRCLHRNRKQVIELPSQVTLPSWSAPPKVTSVCRWKVICALVRPHHCAITCTIITAQRRKSMRKSPWEHESSRLCPGRATWRSNWRGSVVARW